MPGPAVPSMNKQLLLFLLAICVAVASSDAPAFEDVDANRDGLINRSEFTNYFSRLRGASRKPGATATVAGAEEDWGFYNSMVNSCAMIVVTELGDKTFFIAAILAMRHGRLVVFAGCMVALVAMHVLSSLMGLALPALLPKVYTHYASALLFVYFGVKLLKEAKESDGGPSEELQEAEEELRAKKDENGADDDDVMSPTRKGSADLERGGMFQGSTASPKSAQLFGKNALKVFTQACTVTFLAEWGDRSQIATIAMAAAQEPFGVVVGGLIGHALCTGIAVVGGRMLAAKISERTVALVGGILFLVFALHSLYMGPEVETA